jgi:uncharacterized DUF497 family protein
VQFEWSKSKDLLNQRKHGVSFEEAKTVFFDPTTLIAHDPDHSEAEDRFLAIGYSSIHRLLLVVHCYRQEHEVLRIISARKATKAERRQFEEGL